MLEEKDDKYEKNIFRKIISKLKKIKLKNIKKRIMLNWTFKVLSFFLASVFWMYIVAL